MYLMRDISQNVRKLAPISTGMETYKTVWYGIKQRNKTAKRKKKLKKGEREKSKSQIKGKGHPRAGHEGPEGDEIYSSTLSLTSALDADGWSKPRPGRFTPRKENRYPFYRRLGGFQGQSEWVREISPPQRFDP
jgi:hypothetical protein